MNFSVLMSVYKNEKAEFFKESIESVLQQTVLPDEIILIRDGIVPGELQKVIDFYVKNYDIIKYIPLEVNGGLGNALNIGVREAKNDLVARMDSDDICEKNRFELQIKYFIDNPDVAVCGGQILEFINSPDEPEKKREVPLKHEDICEFIKLRNPFNHMTVMFKKSAVIDAGNYIELPFVEDYYLWCRMFLNGAKFANLKDVLVNVRIGKDMYRRRGGYKYFKSCLTLEKFKYRNHIIGKLCYIKTVSSRFIVQVLMPNNIRGWFMKTFLRK